MFSVFGLSRLLGIGGEGRITVTESFGTNKIINFDGT